jgi:hypothetical protein
MTRQLLFVHGRAQEHKDPAALKTEWIGSWIKGLEKNGLTMPITESAIRFPYYGQTLYELLDDESEKFSEVVVKGNASEDEKEFMHSVVAEMCKARGIESKLREVGVDNVMKKGGPLNWGWVREILKAVDEYLPGSSGASIAIATNDVYQYLRNPGIRDTLEEGVRNAISARTETVVVSHSLGTVVAYNLLRREGSAQDWTVPLFVTLGSPLAVTAIHRSLRPIQHPKCVTKWFNAMDEHDVVALYPLDQAHFDIAPEIENKTDIHNNTENRHGISGYLDDEVVAKTIYDALKA